MDWLNVKLKGTDGNACDPHELVGAPCKSAEERFRLGGAARCPPNSPLDAPNVKFESDSNVGAGVASRFPILDVDGDAEGPAKSDRGGAARLPATPQDALTWEPSQSSSPISSKDLMADSVMPET